jgi:hypothetical protein
MTDDPNGASMSSAWRNVFRWACLVSAGVLLSATIAFSRASGQAGPASRVTTTASHAAAGDGELADTLAVAGPTPTPLPCPGCWHQETINENFDNVTPPALPPDWIATNAQGPPPLWVTSDSGVPMPAADTPPNAAFIDDPAVVSDKRIDSRGVSFFEADSVRLTFRHNFNLEASSDDPNLGFDGGVLELSTDGGNTFQDILDVGGSFVLGGYNRTIATDRGSPIAGRQAWSGNSEGFITTVVNVPPTPISTIRLRWRMASDTSGSNEGWRVDTVDITWCQGQGPPCTPTPTPPTPTPTISPTPTPTASATPRVTPRPRPTPHLRPSP